MNNQIDHQTLESHLRKTTIVSNILSIVVALVVAMGVGYGFYYNTTATLENHSTDIKEIKEDVHVMTDHINEMDVFKGVSVVEIESIESKVEKLEVSVEKMDDKLDQIIYLMK
jgi:hypothetical protein